ncbi:Gfo/Idh/MocA family oxidoreductase [Curtobacterium flaccumfaciens]|nr:Gfo/Idh/MocA family oxidoreductase [Curtobacterium flaccumfaciens]
MTQRFALVGAGFIGAVHAASLAAHTDVDFVGIHDVDRDRAASLAARHGTRVLTQDEAFDAAQVDAVFVASSTDTHAQHLHAAADAGIAVLCEKPIAAGYADAVAVVEHVRASGVPAMLDFNRRWDRDHAELQRIVAAGRSGRSSSSSSVPAVRPCRRSTTCGSPADSFVTRPCTSSTSCGGSPARTR